MIEDNCEELQQLAKTILADRKSAAELTNKGLLSLLKLKESCRLKAFEAERMREATASQRLEYEKTHLELQNKEYEKEYYEKEIHFSRSYKSKYTDAQIDLINEAKFIELAPEGGVAAAKTSARELMKQRLKFELQSRKTLLQQLESIKKERIQAEAELQKRKQAVKQLYSYGAVVDERMRSMQAELAPQVAQSQTLALSSKLISLLPMPLYLLYSQLVAVKHLYGLTLKVSVLGSESKAAAFAAETVKKLQAASAADAAESGPPSVSDPYEAHPLSVLLELQRGPGGASKPPSASILSSSNSNSSSAASPASTFASVRFHWLVHLRVATAHSALPDENAALTSLVPGDSGSGSTLESILQLEKGGFRYDASRLARPYRWCQHLCGLDVLPPAAALATPAGLGPSIAGIVGAFAGSSAEDAKAEAETVDLESRDFLATGMDRYRNELRVWNFLERLAAARGERLSSMRQPL